MSARKMSAGRSRRYQRHHFNGMVTARTTGLDWAAPPPHLLHRSEQIMASPQATNDDQNSTLTRDQLADLLNEDLAREYQAIIAYVVYSQVLKGAEYMQIASH